MTPRERFLQTLLFGTPDRVPLEPGGGRESTRRRWYDDGLPREVTNINEYAYRQAGGQLPWPVGGPAFPVNERMIPQFEEKVLEEREDSRIVQDWKGNICEIGKEYGVEYLRNAIDFVTRRWVKCPVESWADWEAMKRRYDAAVPERLPADPAALGCQLAEREHAVVLHFSGPFWQMREWLGFEGLCLRFHDDPDLIRDMVAFWSSYVAQLLRRALQHLTPDMVHLSEDMAYKRFPMISPAMARQFLLPCWRQWGEIVRGAGVPVYAMDSDGYIGDLIPVWIEAGMNACDPIEVAAGNDLVDFRRRFGRQMAYSGGVDKRAMAAGGQTLRDELQRLAPVIRDGGYIPSCDHGVPADVPWTHYQDYVRQLAQLTGWL
jgi:uroporphyrinogen decarboxylase